MFLEKEDILTVSSCVTALTDIEIDEDEHQEQQNKQHHSEQQLLFKKKRRYVKLKDSQLIHINNISNDRYKIKVPKLSNHDIKRKLPCMILNTLNSLDSILIKSFFHTFTHSDTFLRRQIMSISHRERELERITFYGPSEISDFMFASALICPDRILTMMNSTFITRSDSFRTEIIIDLSIEGTWPYDTNPMKVGHFLRNLYCIDNTTTSDDNDNDNGINVEKILHQHHLHRLSLPIRIYGEGKITLIVSEKDEIDEITFATYGLYTRSEEMKEPSI
eukprot:gene11567-12616_t